MVGSVDRQKVTAAIQESPGRQCRRYSNHAREVCERGSVRVARGRPQSVLGRAAANDVVSGRAIAVRLARSATTCSRDTAIVAGRPTGAPAADSAATPKVATS